MPTLITTKQRCTATALAMCLTPISLLAQEQPPEQASSTTQEQPEEQQNSTSQDDVSATPIPLVPSEPTWDSFHGQLNAQNIVRWIRSMPTM